MDQPTALLDHLTTLTLSLGQPGIEIAEDLASLALSLTATATSYQGLELTVFSGGYPVVLTAFAPQADAAPGDTPRSNDARTISTAGTTSIAGKDSGAPGSGCVTSLRLPLGLLADRFEAGAQVVFYAGRPGAFVDLAADLAYALSTKNTTLPSPGDDASWRGGRVASAGSGQRPAIVLDADRTPNVLGVRISGLAEVTDVNRAAGLMIADGHDPREVHAALRRDAAGADLTPHAYALRLLAS